MSAVIRLIVFFLFPSAVYFGFVTDFSFDLTRPDSLWKMYNEYYLSLISGRLDVPAVAAGLEGQYIGGKTYLYYGLLPALPRALAAPFVDLGETPVASFSILVMCLIGQLYLQYELLRVFLTSEAPRSVLRWLIFGLMCGMLWFVSGAFLAIQNTTYLHEPYAAAMGLLSIFLGLLVRLRFIKEPASTWWLVALAATAAASVHARMPLALGLYAVTVLVVMTSAWKANVQSQSRTVLRTAVWFKRPVMLPMFVLFLGGISILTLNQLRFDHPLRFMGKPGHYGYFIAAETYSPRRCFGTPKSPVGRALRVIPNSIYYFGSAWNTHTKLSDTLGTGFGRKEKPAIALALLWAGPILITVGFLIYGLLKRRWWLTIAALGFWLGPLYQLTYPTLTARYNIELWPFFAFPVVWCLWRWSSNSQSRGLRADWAAVLALSAITTVSLAYFGHLYKNEPYLNDRVWLQKVDYLESSEVTAILENIDDEQVAAIRREFREGKVEGCGAIERELREKGAITRS